MPELLEQNSPEFTTLPLVTGCEHNDHFRSLHPVEEAFIMVPENLATLAVAETVLSFSASSPERSSLRSRFFHSKVGRLAMSGLTTLGLSGGAVAIEASPAYAANPVYTVINPDKDNTKSIYDRNSPRWKDTDRKYPDFSYYGDRLELICGTNGDAVGPNKNKRWHYAKNRSRPEAGTTWIPDYHLNTPNKANKPTPGEKECSTASGNGSSSKPALSAKGCYIDMRAPSKSLTFSYSGDHRYLGNAHKAAQNWTNTGAGIKIKPGSGNTYIKFEDISGSSKGSYGEAIMPDSWKVPHTEIPKNPHVPQRITIQLNRRVMDGLSDFHRTYVITHEIGHALGLAHSTACKHSDTSIMKSGDGALESKKYNTPMPYDKAALKQLYN